MGDRMNASVQMCKRGNYEHPITTNLNRAEDHTEHPQSWGSGCPLLYHPDLNGDRRDSHRYGQTILRGKRDVQQ